MCFKFLFCLCFLFHHLSPSIVSQQIFLFFIHPTSKYCNFFLIFPNLFHILFSFGILSPFTLIFIQSIRSEIPSRSFALLCPCPFPWIHPKFMFPLPLFSSIIHTWFGHPAKLLRPCGPLSHRCKYGCPQKENPVQVHAGTMTWFVSPHSSASSTDSMFWSSKYCTVQCKIIPTSQPQDSVASSVWRAWCLGASDISWYWSHSTPYYWTTKNMFFKVSKKLESCK